MSKLSITGTDKLMKQLQKGAKLDDVKKAIQTNASELQQEAMRQAPVDTGALKRSIIIEFEDSGFTAKIKPTMDYAAYVNYGTRFQTAKPFMTGSFNRQKPKFISDMKKLLK